MPNAKMMQELINQIIEYGLCSLFHKSPELAAQFWPELAAHLVHFIIDFGHSCASNLFFFFFGTFGPDRMGLTAPSEYGIAKGQLIFF